MNFYAHASYLSLLIKWIKIMTKIFEKFSLEDVLRKKKLNLCNSFLDYVQGNISSKNK